MRIRVVIQTVLIIIGLVVVVTGAIMAINHFRNLFVGIWSNGTDDGRVIIESNGNAYISSRMDEVESFTYEYDGGNIILMTHIKDPDTRFSCTLTSDGHLRVYIPWDAPEPSQILIRVKK